MRPGKRKPDIKMSDVRNRPTSESEVPRGTSRIRHFTDLIVWQKAFQLGVDVFALSRNWPPEERFSLTDQVRRSARSVSGNIAEAWGKRRYEAHFVSKLTDSDTELQETENWLLFAETHGYITKDQLKVSRDAVQEIGRMLGSIMANPTPFLLKAPCSRANLRSPYSASDI